MAKLNPEDLKAYFEVHGAEPTIDKIVEDYAQGKIDQSYRDGLKFREVIDSILTYLTYIIPICFVITLCGWGIKGCYDNEAVSEKASLQQEQVVAQTLKQEEGYCISGDLENCKRVVLESKAKKNDERAKALRKLYRLSTGKPLPVALEDD